MTAKSNLRRGKSIIIESDLLTVDFIVSKGFKLVENKEAFENFNMPYYAKEGVLLFFNTPETQWSENDFYVGYGEMRCGKYYAVAFRWINKRSQLIQIYEAITGREIDFIR